MSQGVIGEQVFWFLVLMSYVGDNKDVVGPGYEVVKDLQFILC